MTGFYNRHRLSFRMIIMSSERHVSLVRNGRNQAIRIPREYELEGSETSNHG